ncbi:MAG: hypothetical protein AAF565_01550 [Pseudomonadota bacterium]
MTLKLASIAMAAALIGAPAAFAQDSTNPALARALASVNDDGPETLPARPRGDGFFGRGFFITTDRVGDGFAGGRVGGREDIAPRRQAKGQTILRR